MADRQGVSGVLADIRSELNCWWQLLQCSAGLNEVSRSQELQQQRLYTSLRLTPRYRPRCVYVVMCTAIY